VFRRSQREEWRVETAIFSGQSSLIRALKADETDFLILLPLEYLEISEEISLRPVWTVTTEGRASYEYALLVRKDEGTNGLGHLAGKGLVIAKGGKGRIPEMWLNTVLLSEGLPEMGDLFGSIKEVDKPSQALFPVFFGQRDVCLVPLRTFWTMAELNPQLRESLVVLLRSPAFCRGLMCSTEEVYEQYRPIFEGTLAGLNTDPQGRQLLTIFRADEIVRFEPVHLESVRELMGEYERLKTVSGGGP